MPPRTVLQITDVANFPGMKSATAAALKIYPPDQKTATQIGYSFRVLAAKGKVYMEVVGPIRAGVGIPGAG